MKKHGSVLSHPWPFRSGRAGPEGFPAPRRPVWQVGARPGHSCSHIAHNAPFGRHEASISAASFTPAALGSCQVLPGTMNGPLCMQYALHSCAPHSCAWHPEGPHLAGMKYQSAPHLSLRPRWRRPPFEKTTGHNEGEGASFACSTDRFGLVCLETSTFSSDGMCRFGRISAHSTGMLGGLRLMRNQVHIFVHLSLEACKCAICLLSR